MIPSNTSSTRPTLRKTALLALGAALGLALAQMPALQAASPAGLQPLADKAPALPLTSSFEKKTVGENASYVLTLTNTSKDDLKVTAKVLLSVAFHADSKARNVPEHTIAAGASWTIADLAPQDKVVLTAAGFAPLELTVP